MLYDDSWSDRYNLIGKNGIDYDLFGCLEYNPQEQFDITHIQSVIAEVPGQHNEWNYHWVLLLKDGLFVYLTGWCDYTGWDCQSGAESWMGFSAQDVVAHAPETETRFEATIAVRNELERQLNLEKDVSWRDGQNDPDMPNLPLI